MRISENQETVRCAAVSANTQQRSTASKVDCRNCITKMRMKHSIHEMPKLKKGTEKDTVTGIRHFCVLMFLIARRRNGHSAEGGKISENGVEVR